MEGSYAGKFEVEQYEAELDTTKNRGFSDGYIFNRPREKEDTQNHDTAMSDGSYQVDAFVVESGEYFLAKGQMHMNVAKEMLLPLGFVPEIVDNEIGKVECIDGDYFITFKKFETKEGIESTNDREVDEVIGEVKKLSEVVGDEDDKKESEQ